MSDSSITLQEYMLKSSKKKKKKKKREYMLKGIMNTNHILDSKIHLQRFLSSWERHLF